MEGRGRYTGAESVRGERLGRPLTPEGQASDLPSGPRGVGLSLMKDGLARESGRACGLSRCPDGAGGVPCDRKPKQEISGEDVAIIPWVPESRGRKLVFPAVSP